MLFWEPNGIQTDLLVLCNYTLVQAGAASASTTTTSPANWKWTRICEFSLWLRAKRNEIRCGRRGRQASFWLCWRMSHKIIYTNRAVVHPTEASKAMHHIIIVLTELSLLRCCRSATTMQMVFGNKANESCTRVNFHRRQHGVTARSLLKPSIQLGKIAWTLLSDTVFLMLMLVCRRPFPMRFINLRYSVQRAKGREYSLLCVLYKQQNRWSITRSLKKSIIG